MLSERREPGDITRIIVRDHATTIVELSDMLARLIEMRDDDGAELIRRRIVSEVEAVSIAMRQLVASGLVARIEAQDQPGAGRL